MKLWKALIPVFVVALFVAWYEFRPERLVVNNSVREELPPTQGGSPAQTVASGTFHSVLHPTSGTATISTVLGMAVALFAPRSSRAKARTAARPIPARAPIIKTTSELIALVR